MDFKEVVRQKDGKVIVITDLLELLKEFYGVESEEQVEAKLSGNSHIIHCPFCKAEGHTKHKLYITPDYTKGHCFVCTRAFVNATSDIDLQVRVPELLPGWGGKPFEVVKLNHPQWSLEKYFYEFDDFSQKGYDYLMNRHRFLDPLYKMLEFKFYQDNIVMPFIFRGEVIYYQIRFTGKSKIKYFFPPISAKPPYIIENGDKENKRFIICEGVFDAVSLLIQAPGFTPFAVLGSSISDYQLQFLRSYVPEEVVVYMDETKLSYGIANKIKSVIDYCPIRVIKSDDGKDPEENMVENLKRGYSLEKLAWIKPNKNNVNTKVNVTTSIR